MPITAQFHGVCSDCETQIMPGEQIERDPDNDGWQHARCHTMPERVECVCSRCFLIHAGEC